MTVFNAEYVRKYWAQDLEDMAEAHGFDYDWAAGKIAEFLVEFGDDKGITEAVDLAREWADEYGHAQPAEAYWQYYERPRQHWDADEVPLQEWMEPGVAYHMGEEGWESDDRPSPQY